MEDKLRRYVDGLFARTVPSRKAIELKEEMLQNLHDKYDDMISEGKTPEAAYNIVIAGVGDFSGLLAELEMEEPEQPVNREEIELNRHKSALRTAVAVMAIILSFMPAMILSMFNSRYTTRIGVPIMFVTIAAACGLLIYNNMTKPKYKGESSTMVGQFRQWQTDTGDRKALRRAISSALWSVLTALYLILSFATDAWGVTWIIFILGVVAESIINIFYTLKK